MSKVLVVEISGKRPGTSAQRPTEKFMLSYDHLIISNNADGYETDWPIVMVPDEYVEWYKANVKTSDNAWYAPMNRSYAIQYARERGYDYLVQLDDNIKFLELSYICKTGEGTQKRYRAQSHTDMMDDFIEMLVLVLEKTNAGVSGLQLAGVSTPDMRWIIEGYCYSFFCLDLKRVPDEFQGDFEDDIEFRYKLMQMNIPTVQVSTMRYSKTGQHGDKDETGNRAAYTNSGLKRGEHMRRLYSEYYACGYSRKVASTKAEMNGRYFKHKIKPFKLGVMIKDKKAIDDKMEELLNKWGKQKPDKVIVKVRKKRG